MKDRLPTAEGWQRELCELHEEVAAQQNLIDELLIAPEPQHGVPANEGSTPRAPRLRSCDPLAALTSEFVRGGYSVRTRDALAALMRHGVGGVVGILLDDIQALQLRCRGRHRASLVALHAARLRRALVRCEELLEGSARARSAIARANERHRALTSERCLLEASLALRLEHAVPSAGAAGHRAAGREGGGGGHHAKGETRCFDSYSVHGRSS